MKEILKDTLDILREYNLLTKGEHSIEIYDDTSNYVIEYDNKEKHTVFTSDNLEETRYWLQNQIANIYWPKRYEVGMVFENETGNCKFTVVCVNDTYAVLLSDYGSFWIVEHGNKKASSPRPYGSTIESYLVTTTLKKLLRV
jgi:hypothetical protein